MGTAQAGDFAGARNEGVSTDEHGTSHISVVDSYGNAAAMTTSIEASFGSFHMVGGFLLNNQLTDFSAEPVDPDGTLVANRVEPNKRPRSSMAPTLVFAKSESSSTAATPMSQNPGELQAVVGSPGGALIIQYVVKAIVGLLDWDMDPQQAVGMVDFGALNSPITIVGGEHPNVDETDDGANDPLVKGLRARGHQVTVADQSSGLAVIWRDSTAGWIGGADPRREVEVMGDVVD